jgi:hypothetical protein
VTPRIVVYSVRNLAWLVDSAPPYGAIDTATNFPEYTSCGVIAGYGLICGVDIRTEALRYVTPSPPHVRYEGGMTITPMP